MKKKRLTQEIISKIITLRQQGNSLPEISELLGVPKTTVFRYTRDVVIQAEFIETWFGKRGGSRKRKFLKEQQALSEASKLFQELSQKEKMLFLAALYWGEGGKKDFNLSNTDPNLIRIFVKGLEEVFGITKDQLRISVRLYEDLDIDASLDFWSKIVEIPKEKFIGVNVLSGKKKGKLKYGMCRVRVTKGGDLLKKMIAINRAISIFFVPIAQFG